MALPRTGLIYCEGLWDRVAVVVPQQPANLITPVACWKRVSWPLCTLDGEEFCPGHTLIDKIWTYGFHLRSPTGSRWLMTGYYYRQRTTVLACQALSGRGLSVPILMDTSAQLYETEATGWKRGLYDDIQRTFRAPIVNWIFRTTMANYPEFLCYAWGQVKPVFQTRAFGRTSVAYRDVVLSAVESAPARPLPAYRR